MRVGAVEMDTHRDETTGASLVGRTIDNSPRALIRYALAALVLTTALVWTSYLVRDVLILIYVAILVAIGLGPLVNSIEARRLPSLRRHVPRWLAILAIYVTLLGVVVGAAAVIVPPLVTQARDLWASAPRLLHTAQAWLLDRGLITREMSVQEAVQQSTLAGPDAVSTVLDAVTGVLGGVFGLFTILILSFYLLVDGERLAWQFVRMFPPAERPRVRDAAARVSRKVSAWLGGQLLLSGIIGASAALGLFLMDVPYFYVLALIAALGEMIPIVGPFLSAIPAVLVALAVSPAVALGVIVFFLVQQQIENHLLVPKLMERQVGVSAVFVIVALLLGGRLLGIVGAILAVPTAAIVQVLLEELWPDTSGEGRSISRVVD